MQKNAGVKISFLATNTLVVSILVISMLFLSGCAPKTTPTSNEGTSPHIAKIFNPVYYANLRYDNSALLIQSERDQKLEGELYAGSPERKTHPEWFDKETREFIGTMTTAQKQAYFNTHNVRGMINIAVKQSNSLICGVFDPTVDIKSLRTEFSAFPDVILTDEVRGGFDSVVFKESSPLTFTAMNKNSEDTLTYTFEANGTANYKGRAVSLKVVPEVTINKTGHVISVSQKIYSVD